MDHDLPLHPKGKDPFFYVFPQGGCSLFRAAAPLSNDVGSWRILVGPPARGEPSVLLMHHGTTEVDHGTGRDFGGTCGGALEHFFFFGGSSRRLPSSVRRSQSQGSNGRIAIPGREPLSTSPQAANFLILFRRQYFHNAVSILLASIRKILCGPIVEPGSLHGFA